MSSREDKVYARVFERKAYGFACFKQVSDERLRPGTCGYFDFDGDWHPILQLIEKEEPPAAVGALEYIFNSARRLVQKEPAAEAIRPGNGTNKDGVPEAEELSAVPALTEHSGEEGPWGPIVSEGVRGSQIDLKVEGKTPDGTGVGLGWKYTSSREESAILVTEGKITHKQTAEADQIRTWMSNNLEKVVKRSGASKTIRKQGIWIVTKTYTAKRAAISVLRSKNSEACFSITAATHGAEASPSVKWWNASKDSSWKVLEDENGVVLFMAGIWWGANPLLPFSRKMKAYEKRKDQKFLDADGKPVPVTVVFTDEESQEGSKPNSEIVQFVPRAVGVDPSFRGIRAAKKRPLAEPGDDDYEEKDESTDESTDDESEEEE